MRRTLLLLAFAALTACGDDDARIGPDPGSDTCGDLRRAPRVFFGTLAPTHVPLTPGQVLAIGTFGGCSGALIADGWVLTARHCGLRAGTRFCIGEDPEVSNICFTASRVIDHDEVDMTLVQLDVPASSRAPTVQPIPIMTERMDETWIGTLAEASGFGQEEDMTSGERKFTAEPIVELTETRLSIDGEGMRGVCFGDSGGPVMVIAADGTVRVAGDLSGGDPSCVGVDNYVRTDVQVEWIESFTGPTAAMGARCGAVDQVGRCVGGSALYCEGESVVSDDCGGGVCGWSDDAFGFRCLEGADPCEGVDGVGVCVAGVARWCDFGTLRERDCRACSQICGTDPEYAGVYCLPDPCEGLDSLGRCDGDVAVWCDEGVLMQRDCARRGGRCGYVNDDVGYFCNRGSR